MNYRSENLNALARILGVIEDPRGEQGKRHRLIDVFILAIYGSLFGYTDFVNMADDLKYKEDYFTDLLGLKYGIPSHDTFSAVFSVINPAEFLECFINWISWIAETRNRHVSFDGKAVRAACDKVHKGKVPYIVNAYLVQTGLCIGQIRIDEKTNEIKGIPEMIEWLDLEGAVVTIDAIGCQKEIVRLLVEKGADYVLPVKENQPGLHSDIVMEMEQVLLDKQVEDKRVEQAKQGGYSVETPIRDSFGRHEENDHDHGRIERRLYYVWNAPESVDREAWINVRSIGMIVRERVVVHRDGQGNIVDEEGSSEVCTYIMSREMDAEEFACYARGHWGIETSLHWVLDDCFKEDRCTSRIGHATENRALLRKIVYNLMKLDENVDGKSMQGKHVYYKNNPDAICKLLFEDLPGRY